MTGVRLSMTAILTLVLVPLSAARGSAAPAPPVNDRPAGAVVITVGERVEQDTSQATSGPRDQTLNADCGAPFTNASVWFRFTATRAANLLLTMRRSDYRGGFLVFAGPPQARSLVTCGPDVVGFHADAGTTYYVMVFSDTKVNGGSLVLTLKAAPPPPELHVRVARRGLAYRGGAARIHGSYSCKGTVEPAFLTARMMQRAGRLKIPARAERTLRCDGVVRRWSVRLVSRVGIYAGGPARVRVRVNACGRLDCSVERAGRTRVELVPARRRVGRWAGAD